MKTRLAWCLSSGLFLAACGGAITGPIGDGGAEAADGGGAPPSPPPPPPTVSCDALAAKINARRQELKVCCPFCGTPQCSKIVQDVCCPFSATATNVSDFEADVALYKKTCDPLCPGVPCAKVPSNVCDPTQNKQGSCR